MTEPRTTPEVYLDPDGRPMCVIDREGWRRDLTVWGMVCAQSVDGVATALVCTDTGDPPSVEALAALADALDGDRAGRIRRQEAEALRAALVDARADLGRWREMHNAQGATIRQFQQELAAARSVDRDVARLAVIALTRRSRIRRRLAHLIHRMRSAR